MTPKPNERPIEIVKKDDALKLGSVVFLDDATLKQGEDGEWYYEWPPAAEGAVITGIVTPDGKHIPIKP